MLGFSSANVKGMFSEKTSPTGRKPLQGLKENELCFIPHRFYYLPGLSNDSPQGQARHATHCTRLNEFPSNVKLQHPRRQVGSRDALGIEFPPRVATDVGCKSALTVASVASLCTEDSVMPQPCAWDPARSPTQFQDSQKWPKPGQILLPSRIGLSPFFCSMGVSRHV